METVPGSVCSVRRERTRSPRVPQLGKKISLEEKETLQFLYPLVVNVKAPCLSRGGGRPRCSPSIIKREAPGASLPDQSDSSLGDQAFPPEASLTGDGRRGLWQAPTPGQPQLPRSLRPSRGCPTATLTMLSWKWSAKSELREGGEDLPLVDYQGVPGRGSVRPASRRGLI